MMKSFVAAGIVGAASALSTVELKYMNYLAEHGKHVANAEEFNARIELFDTVDRMIEEHNAEGHNYELGHNQFSDMRYDE